MPHIFRFKRDSQIGYILKLKMRKPLLDSSVFLRMLTEALDKKYRELFRNYYGLCIKLVCEFLAA